MRPSREVGCFPATSSSVKRNPGFYLCRQRTPYRRQLHALGRAGYELGMAFLFQRRRLLLKPGWLMPSASAAFRTLLCSATAWSYCRSRCSICDT